MRTSIMFLLAAAMIVTAAPAFAELQNVQVGGEIQIRYNYIDSAYASPNGFAVAWPAGWLRGRPIGTRGTGILTRFAWDADGNSLKFTEQRTRLNVKADFTNEVSAFIEMDSYDIWGEDFRSNYISGADFRQFDANDDVALYQAYVEANNMWGMPLRARVGRQEIKLGNQWLVGVNDTSWSFTGLSFDALRLTYATDMFSVDAIAAKLAENGLWEEDGDVDFYALYGSYLGLEDITIDAYYMLVRDARSLNDTNFTWWPELVENWLNVDDYDVTNLNTIGLRGAGTIGAFDFDAEVAYQWGNADAIGWNFAPFLYGDDGADFSTWGANVEVGYTFDIQWQPRVYLGYAYLGGEDNRDISWLQWISPFDKPEASVSFNRLFSNVEYSEFLENTDLSNAHVFRGGVKAMPTESVELLLSVSYFLAQEEFDSPVYWDFGGFRIPLCPVRSYAATENDNELGWEVGLYATYHYTEDLSFKAGYAHLFVGDGLTDGAFSVNNGLGFTGGAGDDDPNYFFVETKLAF